MEIRLNEINQGNIFIMREGVFAIKAICKNSDCGDCHGIFHRRSNCGYGSLAAQLVSNKGVM